jgi:hypothetical protein
VVGPVFYGMIEQTTTSIGHAKWNWPNCRPHSVSTLQHVQWNVPRKGFKNVLYWLWKSRWILLLCLPTIISTLLPLMGPDSISCTYGNNLMTEVNCATCGIWIDGIFLVFINWKERNPKKESEMSYNYLFNSWLKYPRHIIA